MKTLTIKDGAKLKAEFERLYEQVYGLRIPNQEAEAITWSVTVSSQAVKPKRAAKARAKPAPKPRSKRTIYDPALGKQVQAPVYWRFDMQARLRHQGPGHHRRGRDLDHRRRQFQGVDQLAGIYRSGAQPMSKDALAAIRTQVMWNRLIAVVEEQAQSLLRTAFGTITREAGDLSAGVYDVQGNMIAQAMTGTPGHVNTMATAVGAFLQAVPAIAR